MSLAQPFYPRDILAALNQDVAEIDVRQFTIRNYGAIDEVTFPIANGITAVIGRFGTGKTQILSAVEFLAEMLEPGPNRNSQRRSRSHLDYLRGNIPFEMTTGFHCGQRIMEHHFQWRADQRLIRESMTMEDDHGLDPLSLWFYQDQALHLYGNKPNTTNWPNLFFQESVLHRVDQSRLELTDPLAVGCRALKTWAEGVLSLGHLQPECINQPCGESLMDAYGHNGERTNDFLLSLPRDGTQRIIQRLKRYDARINNLLRGKDRCLYLLMRGDGRLTGGQMGSGWSRLVALAAIPEFNPGHSLITLDDPLLGLGEAVQKLVLDDLADAPFPVLLTASRLNTDLLSHRPGNHWLHL